MAVSLALEAVSFTYPDGQRALRAVSLEVAAGETVGVLGPNGSGKSTLLLHLNGSLRGAGAVRVGDLLVAERTLPQVRSMVGMVFQDPDDQLFMPTVFDDVAFGPRCQGLREEAVRERVRRALAVVEMIGSEQRPPHHLSIGQKRRVAVATVLAMDCEALVLDEPTSGLDPRGRREIARFLAGLPQTRVLATHDLELAVELCDRVAVLYDGEIRAEGPPRQVLADEELMLHAGLEVPHSLRFHDAGIPHRHGLPPAPTATLQEP